MSALEERQTSAAERALGARDQGVRAALDSWLATLFDPESLDEPCAQLAASSGPDAAADAKVEAARRTVADCDQRLDRYRAALDSGADPTVVAAWIADAQGEKLIAERVLAETSPSRSTPDEIRALLTGLGDITAELTEAAPELKAKVYRETLYLRLVYLPDEAKLLVTASPTGHVLEAVSEGGLEPPRPKGH